MVRRARPSRPNWKRVKSWLTSVSQGTLRCLTPSKGPCWSS